MAASSCPNCEQPVRTFHLTDPDRAVLVDVMPRFGTLRRTDAVFNEAIETDPHPGGWAIHVCGGNR